MFEKREDGKSVPLKLLESFPLDAEEQKEHASAFEKFNVPAELRTLNDLLKYVYHVTPRSGCSECIISWLRLLKPMFSDALIPIDFLLCKWHFLSFSRRVIVREYATVCPNCVWMFEKQSKGDC